MPRNGSGVYTLPAGNPVVPATVIRSVWANTTMADIATALTNSLAKDGQTVPTANLPMGGFKFTNVGAATNANEYITAGQEQGGSVHVLTGVTNTAPNTYTANLVFGITTFVFGQTVICTFPAANLGPVTLDINGGGPKAVLDDGGNPFIGGEIVVGAIFVLCWDGTGWRVINSPGLGAGSFLPLAGGTMTGRINVAINTPFDLNGGVVNAAIEAGLGLTLTVPNGKYARLINWDSTYHMSGAGQVAGFEFQPVVTTTDAADNVYGVIGAPLMGAGPGACKSVYGRARGQTGFTGTLVGVVGAVTVDPGVTPANAWAVQLEHQGHLNYFIYAGATLLGELADGGIVFNSTTKMMGGAAFQYNKHSAGGATASFARMYSPTGVLIYDVDQFANTKGRAFSPQLTESGPGATFTADFQTQGQTYNINMSANLTITVTNVPPGAFMRFLLQSTTGKTVAFAGGIASLNWPNGVPPTLDVGPAKMCLITLYQFSSTGSWVGIYTTY